MRSLSAKFAMLTLLAALFLPVVSCSEKIGDTGIKGVVALDGSGMSGAVVSAYEVRHAGDGPPVATATTDGDGNFSIELGPGSYLISARLERTDDGVFVTEKMTGPVAVLDGIAWAGEVELVPESGAGHR